MMPASRLILALVLTGAGLAAAKPPTPPRTLSSPPRAAAAAARVRPALDRDLAAAGFHFGDPVLLRVFKDERVLELFIRKPNSTRFALFRSYPIAAASGELGPKLAEGDGQVPEGFYEVPASAMKPDSRYHLAFNLGFPNACDRANGRTGSWIMVHGNQVSIGCLAMTDAKIEEIYTLCAAALGRGQAAFPVQVLPFRMTRERMAQAAGSRWLAFWQNLQPGYERFEATRVPPRISVHGGLYQYGD